MGNKLTRRRQVVDERYTRPQGLYPIRDVDQRKLRKLILDAKLAPCYPGDEEQSADLDECPICFLYYPSLNRSRCCTKGICTECFLQMKPPNSSRSTQCPFCKTPSYCVEYRGARTHEEKVNEQAEEQKVIEAKIKIQQQELKAEKERAQLKQEALSTGQVSHSHECHQNSALLSSSGFQTTNPTSPDQNDIHSMSDGDPSGNVSNVQSSSSGPLESRLIYPLSGKAITRSQTLPGRHNRNDDFDLDLEDIMVMEAIWLSIHENHTQMFTGSTSVGDGSSRPGPSSDFFGSHESSTSISTSRDLGPNNSVTGGLACAIAALAERQVLSTDSSARHNSENQRSQTNSSECDSLSGEDVPYSNTGVSHGSTMLVVNPVDGNRGVDEEQQSCSEDHNSESGDRGAGFHTPDNWIEVSLESGRAVSPCAREGSQGSTSDWVADHSSEVVEVGTSFSSSVRSTSDIPWASEAPQSTENAIDAPSLNGPPYAIPESYEEQIMLALALSLAEARAQS